MFGKKFGEDEDLKKYVKRYGLKRNPFAPKLPSPDLFVPIQKGEIRLLKEALSEGKVAVVTGRLGMGKTALSTFLVSAFKSEIVAKQTIPIFIRASAYEGVEGLAQYIGLKLGLATLDRAHLFETLGKESPERLVIIVDDVSESGIHPRKLGEFLRALADIERVGILLNGTPQGLKKFLKLSPALQDRVQVSIRLKPMNQQETSALLELRVKGASARAAKGKKLLTKDALKTIHRISKGVPRKTLHAADRAFFYAAKLGTPINSKIVARANRGGARLIDTP